MMAAIHSAPQTDSVRPAQGAAFGVLGFAVALVVPLLLVAVPRSEVVVLVGAPGSDAGDLVRIVAAAGGSIVTVDGGREIAVARAEDDGFVGRLYAAGARLVLDGRGAGGCVGARRDTAATSRSDPHFESVTR